MAVRSAREENAYTLGVQAGLWGYPLAHRVEAFPAALTVHGIGLNSLRKFDRLKTADDRFVVTPNNLTIDGYAILDVSHGPVVVNVPVFRKPRWFIVQLGDAFDDVVVNVGGTKAPMPGAYVVTGPDHHGRVPGDMTQVRMRTNIGFVGLRIAVTGSADVADAVAEQEGFAVRPLHDHLEHGIAGALTDYGPIGFPELTAPADLALYDRIGVAMRYMLPVSADVDDTFVQALATIGLTVGGGFAWQDVDDAVLAGLRRAAPMVERIIDERWDTMSETVDGWRGSLASGRCSYDWSLNAANTKNQVGTELADQVVYLNCRVDESGKPLDASKRYELHFEPGQLPPVAGMWNLAMYDDDMFFVHNDLDRFTVGSTTDGVTPARDGSLTVHIQHARPDDVAHWLPAPAEGSFNLTMRFYAPLSPVLDRTYRLPPVREIG